MVTDLAQLLRDGATRWRDREALFFDATSEGLSFGEFDDRTEAIAQSLIAAGVVAGDRILVSAANGPMFPLAWFGILKAGAVMVPLNTAYRYDDARHLVADTDPVAAFCDAERSALMLALQRDTPSIKFVVAARQPPDSAAIPFDGFAARRPVAPVVAPPLSADTLCNIQFTSGTSGLPKGCMLSHRYWLKLAGAVGETVITLAPGETMLTAQAFSYLDPQWALVMTLMSGARLVVLEKFSPSKLWPKIVQHDASFFYCLAAMPLMMLSCPPVAEERRHRLRAIMCSAIPAGRHAELERRFAVSWFEAYGSTETGSDLGIGREDHAETIGSGTLGRPLPHREAMIADEARQPLGTGEVGELFVRGPGMMQGYWRNPEATADAFHDGWYRTGDLARRDDCGFYYLVGRRKDMIRRAGENIAAAEVEGALQQHPAVVLAACVAVPDPVRNEEVKAFVILADPVEVADLVDFLKARLAGFKIPRYWRFVDALPMTASERVVKPQLSRSTEDAFDRANMVSG